MNSVGKKITSARKFKRINLKKKKVPKLLKPKPARKKNTYHNNKAVSKKKLKFNIKKLLLRKKIKSKKMKKIVSILLKGTDRRHFFRLLRKFPKKLIRYVLFKKRKRYKLRKKKEKKKKERNVWLRKIRKVAKRIHLKSTFTKTFSNYRKNKTFILNYILKNTISSVFLQNLIKKALSPLRNSLKTLLPSSNIPIKFNIKPVTSHITSSNLIAKYFIRRLKYNHKISSVVYPVINNLERHTNATGAWVKCCGRFTRRQRASFRTYKHNNVPRTAFRIPIDYSVRHWPFKFGIGNIKLWLHYKYARNINLIRRMKQRFKGKKRKKSNFRKRIAIYNPFKHKMIRKFIRYKYPKTERAVYIYKKRNFSKSSSKSKKFINNFIKIKIINKIDKLFQKFDKYGKSSILAKKHKYIKRSKELPSLQNRDIPRIYKKKRALAKNKIRAKKFDYSKFFNISSYKMYMIKPILNYIKVFPMFLIGRKRLGLSLYKYNRIIKKQFRIGDTYHKHKRKKIKIINLKFFRKFYKIFVKSNQLEKKKHILNRFRNLLKYNNNKRKREKLPNNTIKTHKKKVREARLIMIKKLKRISFLEKQISLLEIRMRSGNTNLKKENKKSYLVLKNLASKKKNWKMSMKRFKLLLKQRKSQIILKLTDGK